MLCLRSTPLDHSILSPAELLNSRVYQANLPAISKPSLSLSADGDTNSKLRTRLEKQQRQYHKTSKPLPAIYPGDPVRVFNPHSHKWEPGVVKCSMQTPRSLATRQMAVSASLTAATSALQGKPKCCRTAATLKLQSPH